MKKTCSLFIIAVFACTIWFSGCTQELKPYEIIYEGHRISLWMTREEIEDMLGEGTERKSQINHWGADVVAYGENLEIRYARDEWESDPAKQIADWLLFNDQAAQSHLNIRIGDNADIVPAKYDFAPEGSAGYRVQFLQGQNVGNSIYDAHDVVAFYHTGSDGKIEYIDIASRIYMPFGD